MMNRWMHRLLTNLTVACVALLAGVWVGSHSVVRPGAGLLELPAIAPSLLAEAPPVSVDPSPEPTLSPSPVPPLSPVPLGAPSSGGANARALPLLAAAPAPKRVAGNSPTGIVAFDRLGGNSRTDLTGGKLGWFKEGRASEDFEAGFLPDVDFYGEPAASIRAIRESPRPFGALTHVLDAREFSGKRVQLRALVKAEGARDGGALFIRAEDNSGQRISTQQVTFREGFDWKAFEIALDVPVEALRLSVGLVLEGRGQAWMKLVTVNPVVP